MDIRKNWSKQELTVAFNLYCRLPFGQYHKNNKHVIELAKILGRTPSAVALKLCNIARLDPVHQKRGIKGMRHGSKLEEKIWIEFNQNWEELAYQSEVALTALRGQKSYDRIKYEHNLLEGKDKEAIVKTRINQNFFREMILASYRGRCAVCLLSESQLLIAAHIIPWSMNASLRMNPRNGMCMCVLHEKAFDRGLITISDECRLLISRTLKRLSAEPAIQRGFLPYENIEILRPDRFHTEKEFLEFHQRNIFAG